MKTALIGKFKEAFLSVIPVVAIVVVLYFTPLIRLSRFEMQVFLICSAALLLGIALFNLGADMAMSPMGSFIGAGLTKSRNKKILVLVSFLMGLFITIAEPDLTVLAEQVAAAINGTLLILVVGTGVGIFLLISVLKIIFNVDLGKLLMLAYLILFALTALVSTLGKDCLVPLSFDSGGVTTGPITVPFIMSLGVGIASTIGGKNEKENSFGMIAMCSVGPILAVLLLTLGVAGEPSYSVPDYSIQTMFSDGISQEFLEVLFGVLKSLTLIVVFFLIINGFLLKLPRTELFRIGFGLIYTCVGLIIFLTAVYLGFMPVGYAIGYSMAQYSSTAVIVFGFLIGCVVVLAEPAVHVLNHQVEDVTGGAVSRKSMMAALAIGVGISLGLSMLRLVFRFSLLYYLIPGYILSLGLSIFVPGIYTAIAFDSGGVASGPLTSSFILPMVVGACCVLAGEEGVLRYALGTVAMVAMTPLITIQVLGFRAVARRYVRERNTMKKIMRKDDKQIINFDF